MPSIFGNLGNIASLLKEARRLKADLERLQAELAEKIVEGSAGGGMVKAKVNGLQQVVALDIDPAVVNPEDVDVLEDLVLAAVTQGLEKSKEMAREAYLGLTGGLSIPGLTD